jgi:hypothetical protein
MAPRKRQKKPVKQAESPGPKSLDIDNETIPEPVTPSIPPKTPQIIDFEEALSKDKQHENDEWTSDDSFEEKITWSRHRTRVTPGGFTPRHIQVFSFRVPC